MEDGGSSRENLLWTEGQMDYLVHLLVDQSRIPGMKAGGGLKAKAYTTIEKNMVERYERDFTREKIKNKLKYAKPNLTIMKEILNTSGFEYDPIHRCIDVDPQVWSDYIQKYPNRKKYKGPKLWRYYEEFTEVYGDSHATGGQSYTSNSMQLDEDNISFPTTPASQTQPEPSHSYTQMLHDDSPPLQFPIPPSPTTEDPTSTTQKTTSRSKRSRATCEENMFNLLHGIAEDMKTMTTNSKLVQLATCYNILKDLVATCEIQPDTVLKSMDVLSEGMNSIIFVTLDPSDRVPWLRSKFANSANLRCTDLLAMDNMQEEEEQQRVMLRLVFVFIFYWLKLFPFRTRIVHPFREAGSTFVQLMLEGHPRNCRDLLRMDHRTYMALCNKIRSRNLLQDARSISIEEQVAIFLLTIGHNERNRAIQNTFQHSGQTISKYVSLVLGAVCTLGRDYIRRPNDDMPTQIRRSEHFYLYFKDCLGAIDGTHVPAWVPASEQARFRNRKGVLSQNVMAVVGLDTRFHYVLAGWEGSASDSRVLYSALDHQTDPFVVPEGKYYLADGGYPNIVGLLSPYRGQRYHMSEFNARGARAPSNAKELFNHRHSSLRNTVERTFGQLKGRFPILKTQVSYPFKKQVQIVLATCALHNFIIEQNPDAEQFDDDVPSYNENVFLGDPEVSTQTQQRESNNSLRTAITTQMFTDYCANRQ